MFCTGTGYPAGKDFPTLCHIPSQQIGVLIVGNQILGTELTNLFLEGSSPISKTTISRVVSASSVVTIILILIVSILTYSISTPFSN